MAKRKSGLMYIAVFFLILGAAGFIMPLIRGEVGLFSLFGAYSLYAKIACLAIGVILFAIGLVRYLKSGRPAAEEPPQAEKKE